MLLAPTKSLIPAQLTERLKYITLLALDVDGVLSDGTLYFSSSGEELKGFSILDGLGIKLLQKYGVEIAIITGRNSPLTAKRASDLGIKHIIQGREDKSEALHELCNQLAVAMENSAYMGDDLPDLAALQTAAVGFTVPNAHWMIREKADHCTQLPGGKGAVREVAELILHARGCLSDALQSYEHSAAP